MPDISAFRSYIASGAPIVAIHAREKRPVGLAWAATAGTDVHAAVGRNVGLLLGARDGWVDVDLDSPEARQLAAEWLPEPVARWGRNDGSGVYKDASPGAPKPETGPGRACSHYLYRFESVPDSWCQSALGVELRSKAKAGEGLQSVIPPSIIYVDKNGDGVEPGAVSEHLALYSWCPKPDGSNGAPTFSEPRQDVQAATDLATACRFLAIAAIAARLTKNADGKRHDIFLALCGGLAKTGWPDSCIQALVASAARAAGDPDLPDRLAAAVSTVTRVKNGGFVRGWNALKEHWPEDVVKKVIAAAKDVATLEKWDATAPVDGAIVVSGNFAVDNDEIVRILTDVENMFVRGGQLVTITAKGNGLSIEACTEGNITEIATRYGNIQKRGPSGALATFTPDARQIRAILERRTWPGLRELSDVTTMPTLRPDGSVITEPGYDEATKTLYRPRNIGPDGNPTGEDYEWSFGSTKEDAIEGLRALLEPIEEMPFIDNLSRTAWLAFVLTLVSRATINGAVPGFASDAAQGASGKTLAVRVASIIATGMDAASQPFPGPQQIEQTLFSAGASGQRLLFFDNVDRKKAESDALEGAMTSKNLSQRKFHAQYVIEAPFRCVVALSGNNMQFSPTTGRRFLFARQCVPKGVDPATRKFRIGHLLEWVMENQKRLYAAALTVLIAHANAGRPKGSIMMGSFEEWSSVVPAALEWCGCPNPILGTAARAAPSSDTEFLSELLSALAEYQVKVNSGQPITKRHAEGESFEWTSTQLWEYLDAENGSVMVTPGEKAAGNLRKRIMRALCASTATGRKVENAKHVGECLSRAADREYLGIGILRNRIGHGKTRYWRFEVIGAGSMAS